MAFLVGGANSAADTGYDIDNSMRFDGTSAYAAITPTAAGNRRLWTFSCWLKRSKLGATQYVFGSQGNASTRLANHLTFNSNDTILLRVADGSGNNIGAATTNQVFRDTSAWYHFVWIMDTENDTAADRQQLWVNGSRITSWSAYQDITEDTDMYVNQDDVELAFGAGRDASGSPTFAYFSGYLAEIYFINAAALPPSNFGETDEDSGIWKPKDAKDDLTFGTNGFYMEFKETGTSQNSSGIGADTSGNDNHYAVTNLAAIDQTTDTPTNNFATINPLIGQQTTYLDESEGNLKPRVTGTSVTSAVATMAAAAGKWYYEVKVSAVSSYNYGYLGWCTDAVEFGSNDRPNAQNGVILKTEIGDERVLLNNVTQSTIDQGDPNYATGVFIGLFADLDNGNFYWLRNGSLIASLTGETSWYAGKMVMPYNSLYNQSNPGGIDLDWNFGNPTHTISSGNSDPNSYGNFEYTTTYSSVDYYAWCTKNLAEFGG